MSRAATAVKTAHHVVFVGCGPADRAETERALIAAAIEVSWADHGADLVRRLGADTSVLVDLARGAAALQTVQAIRSQQPSVRTFAVLEATRPDLAIEAVLAGVADVFIRPLDGRRVARAVEREAQYATALNTGRPADDHPHGDLYAHSPAMADVLRQLDEIAAGRSDALIHGEEGSGRQMVARALHEIRVATGPFCTLDCSAAAPDELDQTLFGGRRVASRDTSRRPECLHPGALLLCANGGTLYLQNLVDLPTRVQDRLVRVLRDQEVRLADAPVTTDLDVCLVAASDARLDRAMQDGRLHEDLWRRLRGRVIDVPPLRRRQDDFAPLANFFVRQTCAAQAVPPKTLSRPALSLLMALPWQRNVAELRSVLAEVVRGLPGGRGIGLDDILHHVRLGESTAISSTDRTLREARAQFEHEYITAVLERHRGSVSDAARTLGIQRTNLYRKIRTLKVRPSRRR